MKSKKETVLEYNAATA